MNEPRNRGEVTVGELLREAVDGQLDERADDWSSFSAGVFQRLAETDRARTRASLEERAVELLAEEIEAEVDAMAPSFDREFREAVERRVWVEAGRLSLLERFTAAVRRLAGPQLGVGIGAAAVAAAMILLIARPEPDAGAPLERPGRAIGGEVSVERLIFEGTVTVMPDDGITVVWISS